MRFNTTIPQSHTTMTIKIDPPKKRRVGPVEMGYKCKVERDRTKYRRKEKHKNMSGETYGR